MQSIVAYMFEKSDNLSSKFAAVIAFRCFEKAAAHPARVCVAVTRKSVQVAVGVRFVARRCKANVVISMQQ